VVGVIANLALFFGWQALWPHGWQAGPDWPALLIAVATAVALLRYKMGIIRVMAAAACAATCCTAEAHTSPAGLAAGGWLRHWRGKHQLGRLMPWQPLLGTCSPSASCTCAVAVAGQTRTRRYASHQG
jgi:hypothetical protein